MVWWHKYGIDWTVLNYIIGKSDDGGILENCGHAEFVIFRRGIFFYGCVYKLPAPSGAFRLGYTNFTSAAHGTKAFVIEI